MQFGDAQTVASLQSIWRTAGSKVVCTRIGFLRLVTHFSEFCFKSKALSTSCYMMLRVSSLLAHQPIASSRTKFGQRALQLMPSKSQASLINSLPSYHSTELADRDALNSESGLQSVDWLGAYRADPANEPVLTAGAMLSNSAELPPDHIVCSC